MKQISGLMAKEIEIKEKHIDSGIVFSPGTENNCNGNISRNKGYNQTYMVPSDSQSSRELLCHCE